MSKVINVEVVQVKEVKIEIQVRSTWCPLDRQWVYTAMARVEGSRAVYATADWEEDAVQALICKIQGNR